MKLKNYRDELGAKGLKYTKHRSMILMILDNASSPMNAEEIFFKIKERNINVSLSTVYRTMEILAEKELVIKTAFMEDNRFYYEYNRMEHRHLLICTGCSRTVPIENCPVEEYAVSLCSGKGFELTGHRLEIYGICSDCKNLKK